MAQKGRDRPPTEAALAAWPVSAGGWSAAARTEARARLAAMGLPEKRDEYWRYTDPERFTMSSPSALTDLPGGATLDVPGQVALRFSEGHFVAGGSDAVPGGIEFSSLGRSLAADIHWAGAIYGQLDLAAQNRVPRPLATLNTAVAREGALIRAKASVAAPLHLHYSGGSDTMLHHVIRVEPGVTLTLLESGTAGARANTVMEVEVADDGAFHHIRLQQPGEAAAVTHLFLRLGARAMCKSFTLSLGGALTRNEAFIDIVGADALAHIAGAVIGSTGGVVHHDDTVFVRHAAVGGESRQVFKKVLGGGATGVFQGKILVEPGAQKTDGYQISQSLLLDDDSRFLAKPELEIHADDVKCSHGSTTGAIDTTALFYLRSRGIARRTAEALLIQSFLADAVAEIADPGIAEAMAGLIEAELARRG